MHSALDICSIFTAIATIRLGLYALARKLYPACERLRQAPGTPDSTSLWSNLAVSRLLELQVSETTVQLLMDV